MRFKKRTAALGVAVALALPAAVLWQGRDAEAADHNDPPSRTTGGMADKAADIADLYAFHDEDSVVVALTFAGPMADSEVATYDRDVLYQIHISNDATAVDAEHTIEVRFAQDSSDNWGVQLIGVPGASGPIEGSVETVLEDDSVSAFAGLRDDPFFFDLQGFMETKNTGTLSFDSTRDFFAGLNVTAVVVEFPRDAVANGSNPLNLWATTSRIPGGA